jgi:hypothetical protein
MSITVTCDMKLTTVETLATNVPAASANDKTVTQNGFNVSALAITATKDAYFVKTLSGGAATIDLTALVATNNLAVDGTALKVKAILIKNNGANALTVTPGASNGYNLFGAASSFEVCPGCTKIQNFDATVPDIASNAKTLDLTGSGTQTSNWAIVMG